MIALEGHPVAGAPEPCLVDGWCPFLTCLVSGAHIHPICPECGCIRYGNYFCVTCRAMRPDAAANPVVEVEHG